MASRQSGSDPTTVMVHRSTHSRLKELRPSDSMSFNDLIEEMADVYETHRNER